MNKRVGIVFLVTAGLISFAVALAHLSCLYLGPQCYSVQMAPEIIVDSARKGTWLAPFGNVLVSSIFILIGLYALSAAKIIRPLPVLSGVVYFISVLCIIRGILPLQLWLRHPEKVSDAVFWVGVGWLFTGLIFLAGYRIVRTSERDGNEH